MSDIDGEVVFFSEYFWIKSDENDQHHFFNIILDADLPVFIDPFLIFCSDRKDYQLLYDWIINYLRFLTHKSIWKVSRPEFDEYFLFQEVQETHIGYSLQGNPWKWLWRWFWNMLMSNLRSIFINPANNKHIEKLCIIADNVWKDKISDFTINLIKQYLVDYTAEIANGIKDKDKVKEFTIRRYSFDYTKNIWLDKKVILPNYDWEYVLLIPKDILTKWETWINKNDFIENIYELGLPQSISNTSIRFQLNTIMMDDLSKSEKVKEIKKLIKWNPEIIEWYIKYKEDNPWDVSKESYEWLLQVAEMIHPQKIEKFSTMIHDFSSDKTNNSLEESISLILYFKDVIENKWMWKEFWLKWWWRVDEKTVQNFFKLTWRGTKYYISAEPDNGTGPVDFIVSMWADDVSAIEFKLASNPKSLPTKQVESYKKSQNTVNGLIVVFCFDQSEIQKIEKWIDEKKLEWCYLIDVTPQDSASKL